LGGIHKKLLMVVQLEAPTGPRRWKQTQRWLERDRGDLRLQPFCGCAAAEAAGLRQLRATI
jgi:hypothetical protein